MVRTCSSLSSLLYTNFLCKRSPWCCTVRPNKELSFGKAPNKDRRGASYEEVVNAGGSAGCSVGGSWPQWGGAAKFQKK